MEVSVVALRPVEDTDLDALFDQMREPESVWMAAFTTGDPGDRSAFDAHMARVRSSPDITLRAVTGDGRLAGSIASFAFRDQTEVTYWIDRAAWGGGIATRALALFLDLADWAVLYAVSRSLPRYRFVREARNADPRRPGWRSLGSPARCQRVGGLGWACSVHGILPMTLAAISVRSAGSQAMTVSA